MKFKLAEFIILAALGALAFYFLGGITGIGVAILIGITAYVLVFKVSNNGSKPDLDMNFDVSDAKNRARNAYNEAKGYEKYEYAALAFVIFATTAALFFISALLFATPGEYVVYALFLAIVFWLLAALAKPENARLSGWLGIFTSALNATKNFPIIKNWSFGRKEKAEIPSQEYTSRSEKSQKNDESNDYVDAEVVEENDDNHEAPKGIEPASDDEI